MVTVHFSLNLWHWTVGWQHRIESRAFVPLWAPWRRATYPGLFVCAYLGLTNQLKAMVADEPLFEIYWMANFQNSEHVYTVRGGELVVEDNRVLSLHLTKRAWRIGESGSSIGRDFIVTRKRETTKPSEVCKDTPEWFSSSSLYTQSLNNIKSDLHKMLIYITCFSRSQLYLEHTLIPMHTEWWCTCVHVSIFLKKQPRFDVCASWPLNPAYGSTQEGNRVNLLPGAVLNLTYRGEVISYFPPLMYLYDI
jgi:hypothetical protein